MMNIYQPHEYDDEKMYLFLKETDDYFIPALSARVNLKEWAKKISSNAVVFELVVDNSIIGIGATYYNDAPAFSFGTFVCVKKEYQKEMYGVDLIQRMIDYAKENGSAGFKCEVRKSNKPLVKFYKLLGFEIIEEISVPNTTENGLLLLKKFDRS